MGLSDVCCKSGNWEGAGARRTFNIICRCYWFCLGSDRSYIWSGDLGNLPSTSGVIINSGGDPESGDACLCKDPSGKGHTVRLEDN